MSERLRRMVREQFEEWAAELADFRRAEERERRERRRRLLGRPRKYVRALEGPGQTGV